MKKDYNGLHYVKQVCKRIALCVAGIGLAKSRKSGDKIVLAAEHDSERINSLGDGYSVEVRNPMVISGCNYTIIEITDSTGQKKGYVYPISKIYEKLSLGLKTQTNPSEIHPTT
jgi:hypothetical protein